MRKIYLRGCVWILLLALCVSLGSAVMAQSRKVTGKITDGETGAPMPGVTVLVKGSNSGGTTDANGAYSINVPEKATLVFSFVGYATQEVSVGNRSTINLALAPDTKALQEVVVTGYASQSKKDITGAVAVVDVKEMKKVNASNIADQLQGRVAGGTSEFFWRPW